MVPTLPLRAALLAACATCTALAPAFAQDMPAPGAPVQGPPDTAAPGGGYGTDDPDSGRDRGDAGAEGADSTGDSMLSDADRVALRPELPEETPADVAERAASGAPVTTLTDALRLAYWTSPSLLAQRSTVKASDYRIAQARANYGPKLNYSLSLNWQRDSFERFRGGSSIAQGWTTTASAILTQPLFTFGRNVSQERSSRAQFDFQRQVLRSTEQQALLDAITAYIGVLRDRAAVIIAKDNLAALERQLNDNKARLAVREVTATDVQQISTRVSLGQAQVYSAQRDAASSEASFLRMVGVPPGELVPPNPLQLPVRQLEEAYAFAETHSPVILAAQAREKVSRASVAAAKADLMPRVDFQGSGNYGSQSPYNDNLRSKEWRGQFIISGPIFESGLRRARVNEAMAANDADWRLLDASLRESRASLAASWNDWQAQQAAIASYRAAEDSARKAYEGAVLQQRAGLITTLDVLDLARELLVARSNSNTAIANAYIAKARVLAAAGALEQSWLMPDTEQAAVGRAPRKPGHKGEIPVVEQTLRVIDVGAGILRAIDSAGAIGSTATRPVRDPAGARMAPPIAIVPADQLVPPASSPADRPAPTPQSP